MAGGTAKTGRGEGEKKTGKIRGRESSARKGFNGSEGVLTDTVDHVGG